MRHRRRGRILGRCPSHQRALLRNLASALILTEGTFTKLDENAPKVPGRIITTITKAKEVRPLVERCVTLARRSLAASAEAEKHATSAERNSKEWKAWRDSDQWKKWAAARGPVVSAIRQALQLLGDKKAVKILFDVLGPRFADRPGGYTRILRLAKPRLGDSGTRAILEFVGKNDRQKRRRAQAPAFDAG